MKLPNAAELKPYPKMKDSGVEWLGKVPEHWKVLPGRACFREKKQPNLALEEKTVLSLSYGQLVVKPPEKLHGLVPSSFETYQIVNPLDIVIRPTDLQNDWKSLRFGLSRHRGIITSAYLCFRTINNVLPEYGHLLFHSYDLMKVFYGLGSGLRQNLDWSDFKHLPCTIPPLPEQAAIVRFLDHANRRIRRYIRAKQKLIALLEEQRIAATQEVIQTRSVYSNRIEGVADLVERPVHRVATALYTPIGLYNRGGGIFKKEPRNGSELGDSDFFWIEEGDLVLSGQFAWEGAIALAGDTESRCVASHRYPILQGRQNVLETGFLLAFFQTDWGQLLLDHHSRGAAGRNRPLNARTLLKEKIPLPPLRHQIDIVEMLQREKLVRPQAEDFKKLLIEYRTRLIADVVTGKLDVREAAAELPEEDIPGDSKESADEYTIEKEVTA